MDRKFIIRNIILRSTVFSVTIRTLGADMKTLIAGLVWVVVAQADAPPQAVLDSIKKAYTGLRGFHAIATRSQSVTGGRVSAQTGSAEYELAEKPGGKYRARYKLGENEALEVSDGSKTWKALPKAKQWSQINASGAMQIQASDTQEGGEPEAGGRDLHTRNNKALLMRYPAIAKAGREPEWIKEDNYRLGKEKRRCEVVRTRVREITYDLWVDAETGFVLQEVQTTHPLVNGVPGEIKMTTKMKLIEVNDAVDDTAFQFEPENSWKQVEALVLPGDERTSLVGLKAGDFSAKSLDGDGVELSSLRGKVVVLDFWATWCPPCREELPGVDKLRTEFGDKVQFFGVNDEDKGTARGYLRKNNNGLATLSDPNEKINKQYGISAIPTVLIIDREGVIRSQFVGGRSQEELRAAITRVVDGRAE